MILSSFVVIFFYIVLKTYPEDICMRLCVFLVICEYLSRIVRMRKKFGSLFISCVQPLYYKEVSKDTNAYWIRTRIQLEFATNFKVHNVQAASFF